MYLGDADRLTATQKKEIDRLVKTFRDVREIARLTIGKPRRADVAAYLNVPTELPKGPHQNDAEAVRYHAIDLLRAGVPYNPNTNADAPHDSGAVRKVIPSFFTGSAVGSPGADCVAQGE